jgi:hypothetical protein
MEHELKAWMPYYESVLSGEKPFEVRKNDRGFQRGDVLLLREWDQRKAERESLASADSHYTGRRCKRVVTYVLTGESFGIRDGYCVLGLREVGP